MSTFEGIVCYNALEFINTLSLSNQLWWQDNTDCKWIFRGQPDLNYKLLPSIYRLNQYKKIFCALNHELIPGEDMDNNITNTVKTALSSHKHNNDIDQKRLIEILKARITEIKLIEDFLNKCNNTGLDVQSLKLFRDQEGERSSVEYFSTHMHEYVKEFYDKQLSELFTFDYPNVIALARHHGIPSRYLDWTLNPSVAAFFSAAKTDGEGKICVWALNTKFINADYGKGISFHKNINHRGLKYLHIQNGLFTEMIASEQFYLKNGNWPTLDRHLADSTGFWQSKYLKRIEIDKQFAPEIIKKLMRMDISEYHLMPTYDNVAKNVIEQYNLPT